MSDKKNINIQDRGWNDMRSVLDDEMPAKKKKRKFVLWFVFGGAAIAILAWIGMLNLDGSKMNYADTTTTTNKEVKNSSPKPSSKTEARIQNNESILQEEGVKNTVAIEKISSKTTNQIKPNNTVTSSAKNNSEIKKESSLAHQIKKGKKSELKNIDDLLISRVEVVVKETLINNREINNNEKSKSLIDKTNSRNKERLNSIEDVNENDVELGLIKNYDMDRSVLNPILKIPHLVPILLDFEKPRVKNLRSVMAYNGSSLFSSYFFVDGNYQSNIKGLGYGLGAGINAGNSNVEAYLEAGYYQSSYNTGRLPSNFAMNAELFDLSNDSSFPDASAFEIEGNSLHTYSVSVSNFTELTTNIEEVKVNLGIRKRLYKRLKINFGVAYSRLLSATNKTLGISIESEIIGIDVGEKKSFGINSTELYNSGAYSKIDIVPHIGLDYNFASNVYFALYYNHGLKNLIENTDLARLNSISASNDVIYRRNISAKLRFEF